MVRWGAIWGVIWYIVSYWTVHAGRSSSMREVLGSLLVHGIVGGVFGFSLRQALHGEWHKLQAEESKRKERKQAGTAPVATRAEATRQTQQPRQHFPVHAEMPDGSAAHDSAPPCAQVAQTPPMISETVAPAAEQGVLSTPSLQASRVAGATIDALEQDGLPLEVAGDAVPAPALPPPLPPARPAAHEPISQRQTRLDGRTTPARRKAARAEPEGSASPGLVEGVAQAVWRWFTTGNLIARIGVLMLFIGLAFLARFAAQAGYFPPSVRLIVVGVAGIALFMTGFVLRGKAIAAGHDLHQNYAHTLQGAGVGVLYLAIVAAVRMYGLLAPSVAFPILMVIVGFAACIALAQNSLSMAFIGTLGGFAAPLLVSTGSDNFVGLFTYYALLNVGIVWTVRKRDWQALHVLGFVSTFGVLAFWMLARYTGERYVRIQPFVLLFSLLYLWAHLSDKIRNGLHQQRWADGLLLFGNAGITLWMQMRMTGHLPYGRALSAVLLAGIYLATSAWLLGQGRRARALHMRAPLRSLAHACWLFGMACLVLAVPLALSARHTAIAWAVMGAVMYMHGVRQRHDALRLLGVLLHALAALGAFSSLSLAGSGSPAGGFLHPHLPMLLALAACVGATARSAYRAQAATAADDVHSEIGSGPDAAHDAPADERLHARPGKAVRRSRQQGVAGLAQRVDALLPNALLLWGAFLWLLAGLLQIGFEIPESLYFAYGVSAELRPHAVLLLYAGTAFILHPLGMHARRVPLVGARLLAWLTLPCMLLFAAWDAYALDHWLLHGGWLVWPAVIAMHVVMLRRLDGSRQGRYSSNWYFSHLGGIALALLLLGKLLHAGIAHAGLRHSAWQGAAWLLAGAAVLLWLARVHVFAQTCARDEGRKGSGRVSPAWPWSLYGQAYAAHGAGALVVILALGSVGHAMFSSGQARPLPYVPVLNPTDLSVLLALGACALWWRRARQFRLMQRWLPGWAGLPWQGVAAVMGFVVINTMWLRMAHHYGHVPWQAAQLSRSFLVQTGYSILWGSMALALMVMAHRKALRNWWMSGAALLGMTVVKLLLVDLSNSGGKERIVSFIAVGLLMLVVGYFVPVPPKNAQSGAPTGDEN